MAITIGNSDLVVTPKKVTVGGTEQKNILEVRRVAHSGKGFIPADEKKLVAAGYTRIDSETFASLADDDLNTALGKLELAYGDALILKGRHTIDHDAKNPHMMVPAVISDGDTSHPISILESKSLTGAELYARIDLSVTSKGLSRLKEFASTDLIDSTDDEKKITFPLTSENMGMLINNEAFKTVFKIKKRNKINIAVTKDPLIASIKQNDLDVELHPYSGVAFTESQKLLLTTKMTAEHISFDSRDGKEVGVVKFRRYKNAPSKESQIDEIKVALCEEMNLPPMTLKDYTSHVNTTRYRLNLDSRLSSSALQVFSSSLMGGGEQGKYSFCNYITLNPYNAIIAKEAFSRQLMSPIDLNNPDNRKPSDNRFLATHNARLESMELWIGNNFLTVDDCITALTSPSNEVQQVIYDAAKRLCDEKGIDWDRTSGASLVTRNGGITIQNKHIAFTERTDPSVIIVAGMNENGYPALTIHDYGKGGNVSLRASTALNDFFSANIDSIALDKKTKSPEISHAEALENEKRVKRSQQMHAQRAVEEAETYNSQMSTLVGELNNANLPLEESKSISKKNIPLLLKSKSDNEAKALLDSIDLYVGKHATKVNTETLVKPALLIPIRDLSNGNLVWGQRHLSNGDKKYLYGSSMYRDLGIAFVAKKTGFNPELPSVVVESPIDAVSMYILDNDRDNKNFVAAMTVGDLDKVIGNIVNNANPDVTIYADFDYGKVSGNAGVSEALKLSKKYGAKYSYINSTPLALHSNKIYKDISDYIKPIESVTEGNNLLKFFMETDQFTTYPGTRVMNQIEHGEMLPEELVNSDTILRRVNDAMTRGKKLQLNYDQASILIANKAYAMYQDQTQAPIESYKALQKNIIPFLGKSVVVLDSVVNEDGSVVQESVFIDDEGRANIVQNANAGKTINIQRATVTKNASVSVNSKLEEFLNETIAHVLPELLEQNPNKAPQQLSRYMSSIHKDVIETYTQREIDALAEGRKGNLQSSLNDKVKFLDAVRQAIDHRTNETFVEKDTVMKPAISEQDSIEISVNLLKSSANYYLIPNSTKNKEPMLVTHLGDDQFEIKSGPDSGAKTTTIDVDQLKHYFSDSLSALPPTSLFSLNEYNLAQSMKALDNSGNSSYKTHLKQIQKKNVVGYYHNLNERPEGWGGFNHRGQRIGVNLADRIVEVKNPEYKSKATSLKYGAKSGGEEVSSETLAQLNVLLAQRDYYKSSNPSMAASLEPLIDNQRKLVVENIDNHKKTSRYGASLAIVPTENFIWGVMRNGKLRKHNKYFFDAIKQKMYDYHEALVIETGQKGKLTRFLPKMDVTIPGVSVRALTPDEIDSTRSNNGKEADPTMKVFLYPETIADKVEMVLHDLVKTSPIMAFPYLDPINETHDTTRVTVVSDEGLDRFVNYCEQHGLEHKIERTVANSRSLYNCKTDEERRKKAMELLVPIGITMMRSDFERLTPQLIKEKKFNQDEYNGRKDRSKMNSWGYTAEEKGESPVQAFENLQKLNANPPTLDEVRKITNHYKNRPVQAELLNEAEQTLNPNQLNQELENENQTHTR